MGTQVVSQTIDSSTRPRLPRLRLTKRSYDNRALSNSKTTTMQRYWEGSCVRRGRRGAIGSVGPMSGASSPSP
jgi:hypothetical protein